MPRLEAALPELRRTAGRHGTTTSPDTDDDPAGRWEDGGPAAVPAHTDCLPPHAAETTGRLAHRRPVTPVENGADGAPCHEGERLFTTRGVRGRPVDSVGAGDSFGAGSIAALPDGTPLPDALRFAAVFGALPTRAPGDTTAQPTRDEALTRLPETEETPV